MACGARNLVKYNNSIKLPILKEPNIDDTGYNDIKLNLKLLNKYFEVSTLDETLLRRRNEFKTRAEHLQKRRNTLHEREIMFKKRIISYEMYIKELAMKRDRSLRRIDDEKTFIKTKKTEIDSLKNEIEQMQEEKRKLQTLILQYQPHLNLLTQIVDQSDRFHSVDELIEKFDMLYASYQDILMTVKNSNEELSDVQRQLLLTIEKKKSKISLMNNRIYELQQNQLDTRQRIDKIQTEISNYQQILAERRTENGAMKIAIESMFDLVRRYSHRSRRKDLNPNETLVIKLKQIDRFLSDLIYYVDYVNNRQSKILAHEHSNDGDNKKLKTEDISDENIDSTDQNNRWRGPCEIDRREILVKTIDKHERQPYYSYKIRGEDNLLYTIQINTIDKSNTFQARHSLSSNRSSLSIISHHQEKHDNSFRSSLSKLKRSIDTQPRSSISQNTRTTFKLIHHKHTTEKVPFSQSEPIQS